MKEDMSKIKVGNIVQTKRGLEVDKWYGACVFNEDMREFEGKLAKVTEKNDNGSFKIDLDDGLWNWTEEMLGSPHCCDCKHAKKNYKEEPCKSCDCCYCNFTYPNEPDIEVNERTPKEKVLHLREFLVDEFKLIIDEDEEKDLLEVEDLEFIHSILDACIKHKIKTLF